MVNIAQIDYRRFEVFIEGLPDWAIPMIKVVPTIYATDEYDLTDPTINKYFDFTYFWQKVDNVNYRLYIYLSAFAVDSEYNTIPLYADLSLIFYNNNLRDSEQHTLGY